MQLKEQVRYVAYDLHFPPQFTVLQNATYTPSQTPSLHLYGAPNRVHAEDQSGLLISIP